MSSKILPKDGFTEDVSPIRWRTLGSAAGQSMAPGAQDAGEDTVSQAQVQELERRLAQAQSEAAQREAQARQAGIRDGSAAAEQQLAGPLREAATRLAEQVGELAGLRKKLRRDAEEDLVKLAVAMARRILHRELTIDPGAVLGVVKAALDRVDAREVMRLRVHPDDVALVRSSLDVRRIPEKVEVLADTGLERGGIVVETSRGNLDAAIESQLLEIEQGFTDLVRRSNR